MIIPPAASTTGTSATSTISPGRAWPYGSASCPSWFCDTPSCSRCVFTERTSPDVQQQVEPFGHLNRLWGSVQCPLGVSTSAIAGDDLDPGMVLQPRRDALRCPIGEEIDRAMLLEIDEDGPLGLAARAGPVVDP